MEDVGRGGREAGAELEGEGVSVPGEGPGGGHWIAGGEDGEVVGDDDAALGRRGGGGDRIRRGGGAGRVEDARDGHDPGEEGGAAGRDVRRARLRQVQQVRVRSRWHVRNKNICFRLSERVHSG